MILSILCVAKFLKLDQSWGLMLDENDHDDIATIGKQVENVDRSQGMVGESTYVNDFRGLVF